MKISNLIIVLVFVATNISFSDAGQISLGGENSLKTSSVIFKTSYLYEYDKLFESVDVRYRTLFYKDYFITQWATIRAQNYIFAESQGTNHRLKFSRITEKGMEGIKGVNQILLSDNSHNMSVYGDYLFLTDNGEGALLIFDLSVLPSQPLELTEWDGSLVSDEEYNDSFHSLNIRGKYYYEKIGKDRIGVYDISNISNPEKAGEYDASQEIYTFKIVGNYFYLIHPIGDHLYDSSVLTIVKINNANSFKKIGTFKFKKPILGINYLNGYLILSGDDFTVIDISDPINIRKVYSSDYFGQARNVFLFSDKKYAFVLNSGPIIYLIDVDNILHPKIISSYDLQESNNMTWLLNFSTNRKNIVYASTDVHLQLLNRFDKVGKENVISLIQFDNDFSTQLLSTELSTLIPRIKKRKLSLKWDTLYENSIQKFILIRKIAVSGKMQKNSADGKKVNYRRDSRKSIQNLSTDGGGASYHFVDRHLKRGSGYRYFLKYKDKQGEKHLLRKFDITIPKKK